MQYWLLHRFADSRRLAAAAATLIGICAALLPGNAARAQIVVATYSTDFQAPTPTTGWNYLYNRNGAITNSANFVSLVGNANAGNPVYTVDGNPSLPRAAPGSFVFFGSTGGHPGQGAVENAGGFDVYAIAAYTVSAPGSYAITNSSINRPSSSGVSVEIRVFVNNNAPLVSNSVGQSTINFNTGLGNLTPGDLIYVAVGPNLSHGFDSFNFNYSITNNSVVAAPEPGAIVLVASGLLPVLGTILRKRRKA